ncbi:MAG: dihydroneopterin aldolase [Pseudomonadota bacterium]
MDGDTTLRPSLRRVSASEPIRRVFVRGLRLDASIGVHDHERAKPQTVSIDVDVELRSGPSWSGGGRLGETVCYEWICNAARGIAASGHIDLVETFAEQLAEICLSSPHARQVRVRVAKPDAIVDAEAVGIEIERQAAD